MEGVVERVWLVLPWGLGPYPLWSSLGNSPSGTGVRSGPGECSASLRDSSRYCVAGWGTVISNCWGGPAEQKAAEIPFCCPPLSGHGLEGLCTQPAPTRVSLFPSSSFQQSNPWLQDRCAGPGGLGRTPGMPYSMRILTVQVGLSPAMHIWVPPPLIAAGLQDSTTLLFTEFVYYLLS